ncbi:Putative Holin-X, holin superfamily III [Paracoccus isoporae]|uniref:Putative Holin-X, holin superfamily III n=1 Tax=Paracoccus isoporae TaxID=591205 RepID=A0A1G6XF32_9RHOB|nr:phage holin family protein [Paracoccus isoporae]SDD75925.1 Putative Holin-X, holin superfamily III [Paracoccus isoporae]
MFDYVNKVQLALSDKARRTGLKAGAAVIALIALGFLLSALWSFLAWRLELGPTYASLIIGGGFLLIALILQLMSNSEKHSMPSTDELKNEVEARLSLAADTALDKAKFKAEETMDSAQQRVHALFGKAEDTARGFVSRTESKVHDVTADVSTKAGDLAEKVGLTDRNLREAKDSFDRATQSRAAPGVGIVGAFAVGMAIAGALRGRRDRDDFYYDDFEDDADRREYDPRYRGA